MKNILWISRHPPTAEQITLLSSIFSDPQVVITRYEKSVEDYMEIVKKYNTGKFNDIVVTLPIEVIGKLCKAGINPIRAVHKMTGYEPTTNFRIYKFLAFERICSVTVKRKWLGGITDEKLVTKQPKSDKVKP